MNKPTDFAYYLSKYLCNYLPNIKGVSNNTLKTYTATFKLFCQFMNCEKFIITEKITLNEITKEIILDFLEWIENTKNCCINTRNQRLNVIRSFVRYIEIESPKYMYECQNILLIPKKKMAKKVIEFLSVDGINCLLNTPDKKTNIQRKHIVIMTLLYATAARVSEIINLKICDFKYNGNNLIKLTGKGNKSRLVPLEPAIIKLIEKYLIEQKEIRCIYDKSDYMFLNHSKDQLTRQGITYILKKYIKIANKNNPDLVSLNISVHSLRHSRAIHWLQAGIDLIYIRDLLGHVSVQTTEIYIRIDNKLKTQALKNLSPENYPDANELLWHEDKKLLEWLKTFS